MRPIFLIRPPGSGKTACGQALARRLQCAFHDTDRVIEQQQGRSVTEIFATEGEEYFRSLESALLTDFAALQQGKDVVIATGGGLPVFNNNMEKLLEIGAVIALQASLETLARRLHTAQDRPLLRSTNLEDDNKLQNKLAQLISCRSPVYARAGYKIDTSGLTPDEVARQIQQLIAGSKGPSVPLHD